jgi:hypothetical protein
MRCTAILCTVQRSRAERESRKHRLDGPDATTTAPSSRRSTRSRASRSSRPSLSSPGGAWPRPRARSSAARGRSPCRTCRRWSRHPPTRTEPTPADPQDVPQRRPLRDGTFGGQLGVARIRAVLGRNGDPQDPRRAARQFRGSGRPVSGHDLGVSPRFVSRVSRCAAAVPSRVRRWTRPRATSRGCRTA